MSMLIICQATNATIQRNARPCLWPGLRTSSGGAPLVPDLDLSLVAERLGAQLITLLPAEVLSSTAVKVSWVVRKHHRFIEGFHVRYRAVAASPEDGREGNVSSAYIIRHEVFLRCVPVNRRTTSAIIRWFYGASPEALRKKHLFPESGY